MVGRSLNTLVILSLIYFVSALPHVTLHQSFPDLLNETSSYDVANLNRRQDDNKPWLRIMPLGASITHGYGSDPYNGYRRKLREQLRVWGYDVNMVGSQSEGDFVDRQHEGHNGYKIAEVADVMVSSLSTWKPNLVLVNAGTNDCLQADDNGGETFVANAKGRLQTMLERIFDEVPGVTIILSTLVMNLEARIESYVQIVNTGIRELAQEMSDDGRQIVLADMHSNPSWITASEYYDLTHPNNDGYTKMAAIWAQAFNKVEENGWLSDPIDTGRSDDGGDTQCYPSPDGFRGPVQTQRGWGYDDGLYTHSSEPYPLKPDKPYISLSYQVEGDGFGGSLIGHYYAAQLVNVGGADQPTDELIQVLDEDQRSANKPYISFALNTDGGLFEENGSVIKWTSIDVGTNCLNRGVRWGDVNGDGLDDFICLNLEGNMYVSINRGGNPPTFDYIGQIRAGDAAQDHIRLGDIDGDGRLDYCWFNDTGDIYCVRNGGQGDAPTEEYGGYWQGMVGGAPTFDHKGMPGIEGVRLVDINGDGRADWVYVFEDGSTRIFTNQRGTIDDGLGLKPYWAEAAAGHRGFADLDSSIEFSRDHVVFGKLFGTGRADYIRIQRDVGVTEGIYHYSAYPFQNTGSGATRRLGDGVFYCDMFGRGYDDYLWVWSDGRVHLFENDQNHPVWIVHEQIFDTGKNRKFLHFGDWDGDGKCDILWVDRNTGNVDMWRNTWDGTSTNPTFADAVNVVSGSNCPQKYSPGLYDLAVRFGDLDGDGRVDYLCMEPDGRTLGWLNTESGLESKSQIKFSEGFDRANHRWADVNGDGLVDFLWVDKFAGGVQVWINGGMTPSGGSSMFWDKQPDIWMEGQDRGANVFFPKLSTSGRADMQVVNPHTCIAYAWFNECVDGGSSGGHNDDDGVVPRDPELPTPPDSGDGENVICPRTACGAYPDQSHIIGFGDSYGAGIGAGSRYTSNTYDSGGNCLQGYGAAQLRWPNEAGLRDRTLDWFSCTGDKVENLLSTSSGKRGLSQLQMLSANVSPDDYSIMWLSIGGNDVGFSDIAKLCLLWRGSTCEDLMKFAESSVLTGIYADLDTTENYENLYSKIKGAYEEILGRPNAQEKWLIVTGYGRFFNAETTECDRMTLEFTLPAKLSDPHIPWLTTDIRKRTNDAVMGMNRLIQRAINDVRPNFPGAKIRYVDTDQFYEGHRWCDFDSSTGSILQPKDALMFLPGSPDITVNPDDSLPNPNQPRDERDGGGPVFETPDDCEASDLSNDDAWFCFLMDVEEDSINCDSCPSCCTDGKRDFLASTKYPIMKAFHPKSWIHDRTSQYVRDNWESWQSENIGGSECVCT